MLTVLFLTWLSILPIGSGIINCRIACRSCREKGEHPDMLEVYCAMCDECKERRREWLEGRPSLLRVENSEDYMTNYGQQDLQDDCPTTPVDEPCDSPQLLTQRVTTTTSTTTPTTTTTRKPCPPRPCITSTRSPCPGITCPIPMAIPICQMCPMPMTPSTESSSTTEPAVRALAGVSSATSGRLKSEGHSKYLQCVDTRTHSALSVEYQLHEDPDPNAARGSMVER
ncbi:jg19084 [Pararge aegeria aegeria]|uniref:Jg19084 protein n=1 Tax=Pararge aegeria aegeria TaxID=348720 RepID=A0A8S4SQN9_9NEOP|nr:jg19084 [Pararge aegeria aegeria]